jgi:hypothetical protein
MFEVKQKNIVVGFELQQSLGSTHICEVKLLHLIHHQMEVQSEQNVELLGTLKECKEKCMKLNKKHSCWF